MTLFEPGGALLALQLGGAAEPGGVTAGGDLGDGRGAVLAAKQGEAGGFDRPLVEPGWDEEKEAESRTDVERALAPPRR